MFSHYTAQYTPYSRARIHCLRVIGYSAVQKYHGLRLKLPVLSTTYAMVATLQCWCLFVHTNGMGRDFLMFLGGVEPGQSNLLGLKLWLCAPFCSN